MLRLLIICIATLSVAGVLQAQKPDTPQPAHQLHVHEEIETHWHVGWQSQYVLEGRDLLDGDSIFAGSVELGWEHWTFRAWNGNSTERDYDEWQFGLGYSLHGQNWEAYLSYTHFRFLSDDSDDSEIGLGAVFSDLVWDLDFSVDGYYSLEEEGSFWLLGLSREYGVSDNLSIHSGLYFGMNDGYVPLGHDGANHLLFSLGAEYALTTHLSFSANAAYSLGLSKDNDLEGDDSLKDSFYGGVTLNYAYSVGE